MTDKTPERIWAGWDGCSDFNALPLWEDCQIEGFTEYVRLDLHAVVVAERDQLKAEVQKLEEILHAEEFYRQAEEEAQFEKERQHLEEMEMERHFRENPHG